MNKLSFTRVERKFETHVPVLHSARPVLEEEGNERPQTHVGSSTIPKIFPDRQSALIHSFMVGNEFYIQYLSLLFVLGKRGYNSFFFTKVVPLVRLPRAMAIRILWFSPCFFDSGVVELCTDRRVRVLLCSILYHAQL